MATADRPRATVDAQALGELFDGLTDTLQSLDRWLGRDACGAHHGVEQIAKRYAKRGCNSGHIQDRDVPATALDARHVRAIDVRQAR